MQRLALFAFALCLPAAAAPAAQVPVFLELFTSEGCSSCPPADQFLTSLDRTQPIPGVDLIVLSEHVDYWNNLGWIDRSSSKQFSIRQSEYATRLHEDGVYTPQLLVDGAYSVVGSQTGAALHAITSAAAAAKTAILLQAEKSGSSADVHVSIPSASAHADVYLVLAADAVSSNVTAGENAGHQLTHTAVAFTFQKIGSVGNRPFDHALHAPLGSKAGTGPVRVIVFVQDPKTGHILGITQTKI